MLKFICTQRINHIIYVGEYVPIIFLLIVYVLVSPHFNEFLSGTCVPSGDNTKLHGLCYGYSHLSETARSTCDEKCLSRLDFKFFNKSLIGCKTCQWYRGCSCKFITRWHFSQCFMVNSDIFGKGSYFLYGKSCIHPVTHMKVFYVISYLFHYTRTFISQCKRHFVILYQPYASCQLKNFQRIYGSSHNLQKDFIVIWFWNGNFIYGNFDFL